MLIGQGVMTPVVLLWVIMCFWEIISFSWATKKQHFVAQSSSTVVKYKALSMASSDIVWITYLLFKIGFKVPYLIILYLDNK